MPNYSYATLQNAADTLDARLYDTSIGVPYQQYTLAELTSYIREALRTWNALTGFWRAEMTFPTMANQWWYDLAVQPGSIIPYTVTQNEIIQIIENHLLEPTTPSYPLAWIGSTQFSASDLLAALQSVQDDLLGTTACVITQSTVNAVNVPRTILSDIVIDIRRVAWLPQSGYKNKPLKQSDFWAERAFKPSYTVLPAQPPSVWMQNTEPPPSFDVDTPPPVAGMYDILTVNSGPAWLTSGGSLMNMPDDWTWVVKWGALAELLGRESPAKDTLRADYCLKRYKEGLALLENAPLLLAVRINNIPISIGSIRSADDFSPTWQSDPPARPRSVRNTRNMLALGPAPDGVYSVTASVCQNAPVPSAPGDYIQIARDCYDAIINIAQHLATFKVGGAEFLATIPLYQNAQKKAAEYNGKLKEMGFFEFPQLDLSQQQERRGGRYLPGTNPADSST